MDISLNTLKPKKLIKPKRIKKIFNQTKRGKITGPAPFSSSLEMSSAFSLNFENNNKKPKATAIVRRVQTNAVAVPKNLPKLKNNKIISKNDKTNVVGVAKMTFNKQKSISGINSKVLQKVKRKNITKPLIKNKQVNLEKIREEINNTRTEACDNLQKAIDKMKENNQLMKMSKVFDFKSEKAASILAKKMKRKSEETLVQQESSSRQSSRENISTDDDDNDQNFYDFDKFSQENFRKTPGNTKKIKTTNIKTNKKLKMRRNLNIKNNNENQLNETTSINTPNTNELFVAEKKSKSIRRNLVKAIHKKQNESNIERRMSMFLPPIASTSTLNQNAEDNTSICRETPLKTNDNDGITINVTNKPVNKMKNNKFTQLNVRQTNADFKNAYNSTATAATTATTTTTAISNDNVKNNFGIGDKTHMTATATATATATTTTTTKQNNQTKGKKSNQFKVDMPEEYLIKKSDLFDGNPEVKTLGQRFVKPVHEPLFSGRPVHTLPLDISMLKNLNEHLEITELTNVQEKSIPKILEGKDLLIRAQTGSGKTLAYALPLVEKLQDIRPRIRRECGIQAIVIVPTRELAFQTYELIVNLLRPFIWIVPGILIGGENRKAEKARIRRGINILVGTPGRLADHLSTTENFKLNRVRYLIIDEADRLLDMGYERDVKKLIEAIDRERTCAPIDKQNPQIPHLQRLLLSATLTSGVQKLAGLALKSPQFIDCSQDGPSPIISAIKQKYNRKSEKIESAYSIPENLKLSYVIVPPKLRLITLSAVLATEFMNKPKMKVIIFMSTSEMVNYHHALFTEILTDKVLDEDDEEAAREQEKHLRNIAEKPLLRGIRFFKLFGSMKQTDRQAVYKVFKESKSGILIATDVAGRGIDIPDVDLVIQYTPPQRLTDFVHRVGRTGRAGRSGRAVLFLAPREEFFVRVLEDKRIRISQDEADDYLETLHKFDKLARSMQDAASRLQQKFLNLISEDKELEACASKAFVSWMRFYSGFPKDLKAIFNCKNAHIGHVAKGFGLKNAPKEISSKTMIFKPTPAKNRLTFEENLESKESKKLSSAGVKKNKTIKHKASISKKKLHRGTSTIFNNNNRSPSDEKLIDFLQKSILMRHSEFGNGLVPGKKIDQIMKTRNMLK